MKKFLLLGPHKIGFCKGLFPLIQSRDVWYGVTLLNKYLRFRVPEEYSLDATKCGVDSRGRYIHVKGVCWLTNLENGKSTPPLPLNKKYSPSEYPKYDNYNAIEVSKLADIPYDYDGLMGVPITFLAKWCPEQFDVVWIASGSTRANTPQDVLDNVGFVSSLGSGNPILNGKILYPRILIRHKH